MYPETDPVTISTIVVNIWISKIELILVAGENVSNQNKKPKDIEEYRKWLKDFGATKDLSKEKELYERRCKKVEDFFSTSSFWKVIVNDIQFRIFNKKYKASKNYDLFTKEDDIPQIVIKDFDSFLEKTFRKNVLLNSNWKDKGKPRPPKGGWVFPENWFVKVNDIVRTRFVVKYLDGVEFLMEEIMTTCKAGGIKCDSNYEAKNEGYYAAHLYPLFYIEFPKREWDTETLPIRIEIQITTELQATILHLTHKYYEHRRLQKQDSSIQWQWKYDADEFIPNYLSHILHYVEGMIMTVRDRDLNNTTINER